MCACQVAIVVCGRRGNICTAMKPRWCVCVCGVVWCGAKTEEMRGGGYGHAGSEGVNRFVALCGVVGGMLYV